MFDTKSPECPSCFSRGSYILGDGRRQCKACHRKFTVAKRKKGLSKESAEAVARLFFQGIPADRAAEKLGLNRKTVQAYYGKIRTGLDLAGEKEISQIKSRFQMDRNPDQLDVFRILLLEGRICVLFPEQTEYRRAGELPSLVICAPNQVSFNKLELENFQTLFLPGKDSIDSVAFRRLATHFWIFARNRLRTYRGGIRKNFRAFLREMEFRFNTKNEKEALECLLGILESP